MDDSLQYSLTYSLYILYVDKCVTYFGFLSMDHMQRNLIQLHMWRASNLQGQRERDTEMWAGFKKNRPFLR